MVLVFEPIEMQLISSSDQMALFSGCNLQEKRRHYPLNLDTLQCTRVLHRLYLSLVPSTWYYLIATHPHHKSISIHTHWIAIHSDFQCLQAQRTTNSDMIQYVTKSTRVIIRQRKSWSLFSLSRKTPKASNIARQIFQVPFINLYARAILYHKPAKEYIYRILIITNCKRKERDSPNLNDLQTKTDILRQNANLSSQEVKKSTSYPL